MVRVRLFAALREAAGADQVLVDAGSLEGILAGLRERYGPRFTTVLAMASVLVDGQYRADRTAAVDDGAEVALLPPFSGGA